METIFGRNYENILLKEQMIKQRKEMKEKKEKYKRHLLNKYNLCKVKPKNMDNLIEHIKKLFFKNRNNVSMSLYPSFTERKIKLNKLKNKLMNINGKNENIKSYNIKKIFDKSLFYYSSNLSFNNINIDKINTPKKITQEIEKNEKKGFLRRINLTDKFKYIIKERLNKSENDRNTQNIKQFDNILPKKTLLKNCSSYNDKLTKLNNHFRNDIQIKLKNIVYKESEIFNKRLNNIKKIRRNENMSVFQYQRNLMRIVPQEYSKKSVDNLIEKLNNINRESNSVKAKNNKKFIIKIDKEEKKIINDTKKKMKNFKLY